MVGCSFSCATWNAEDSIRRRSSDGCATYPTCTRARRATFAASRWPPHQPIEVVSAGRPKMWHQGCTQSHGALVGMCTPCARLRRLTTIWSISNFHSHTLTPVQISASWCPVSIFLHITPKGASTLDSRRHCGVQQHHELAQETVQGLRAPR